MFKGISTIPLPLDFPVKDMDSWLKIKPLYTFHEDRIDWAGVAAAKAAQAKGALVIGHIPGGYDTPRQLMGAEEACLGYYEHPELMHDIINTLAETACQVFERITEELPYYDLDKNPPDKIPTDRAARRQIFLMKLSTNLSDDVDAKWDQIVAELKGSVGSGMREETGGPGRP